MRHAYRTLPASALLLLTLLAPAPALAQAEPIHVTAHIENTTRAQGDVQTADCLVENLSGETILVHFTTFVTYADGTVQNFRINQPPTVLGPGEGFILRIFFLIPSDAALGTATFTCTVRALGAAGMGFTQTDTATFEVVAG